LHNVQFRSNSGQSNILTGRIYVQFSELKFESETETKQDVMQRSRQVFFATFHIDRHDRIQTCPWATTRKQDILATNGKNTAWFFNTVLCVFMVETIVHTLPGSPILRVSPGFQ